MVKLPLLALDLQELPRLCPQLDRLPTLVHVELLIAPRRRQPDPQRLLRRVPTKSQRSQARRRPPTRKPTKLKGPAKTLELRDSEDWRTMRRLHPLVETLLPQPRPRPQTLPDVIENPTRQWVHLPPRRRMDETRLSRDHHDDPLLRRQDQVLLVGPDEVVVSSREQATGLELDRRGTVSEKTKNATRSARSAMLVLVWQLPVHALPPQPKILLKIPPKPLVRNKKRSFKLDTRSWHQRLNPVTVDLPVRAERKRLSKKGQRGKPERRPKTGTGRRTRTSHAMMPVRRASEMRL